MPVIQRCSSASGTSRLLAAFIILLGSLPAGAQTADSADREAGEAQYRLACAECHEAPCWKRHSGPHWRFSLQSESCNLGNQALWQPPAWR